MSNEVRIRGKAFPLLIFLSIFFISCQSTKINHEISENFVEVHKGSFSYYISKIDLEQPGLQVICGFNSDGFSVQDFCEESGASYAINTLPFAKEEKKLVPLGIFKFNNQVISEPVERYSALGFYFNEKGLLRARILESQRDCDVENVSTAFGGYFTILKNGEILEYKDLKRSRSACGIDESGRFVYLMAVTSKKWSGKSGFSFMECAEVLKNLGCVWALEFDGGHSTAFVCPEAGYVHSAKNRSVPACMGFFVPHL